MQAFLFEILAPIFRSTPECSELYAPGGELLRDVAVFDLYRGEQVGEGNKSLALRLEFRAPDRTLTDDEVVKRRSAIEAALADLGGKLRA